MLAWSKPSRPDDPGSAGGIRRQFVGKLAFATGRASGIDAIALDTWRWVLDVNLMAVGHGVPNSLPNIRAAACHA
jgi:hypothetical protein